MKQKNSIAVITLLILCPLFFKAQNIVYKDATVSRPAELWKPFVLMNGTNIENGVSFYFIRPECTSEMSKLLKVVNENKYAVIISYQFSPSHPTVNITVPASISIEGACNSIDDNLTKLVITPPNLKNATESEKSEMKQFLLSHIMVTKFQ